MKARLIAWLHAVCRIDGGQLYCPECEDWFGSDHCHFNE